MFRKQTILIFLTAIFVGCASYPENINLSLKDKVYKVNVEAIIATPTCTSWSEKYMLFASKDKHIPNNCSPKKIIGKNLVGLHLKGLTVVKDFDLGQGYKFRLKAFVTGYERYGQIEIPACSYWHPKSWIDCKATREDPPKLILNTKYISEVYEE